MQILVSRLVWYGADGIQLDFVDGQLTREALVS